MLKAPALNPWSCLYRCCQDMVAALRQILSGGYGPVAYDVYSYSLAYTNGDPLPFQIVNANADRRVLYIAAGSSILCYPAPTPKLVLGQAFGFVPGGSPGLLLTYEQHKALVVQQWITLLGGTSYNMYAVEVVLRKERLGRLGT